jgi:SAM-dependent methyltransferase
MIEEKITQFDTLFDKVFKNMDEQIKPVFEEYLFRKGHYARLKKMFEALVPYCNSNTYVIDLGCQNPIIPMALKSIMKVKQCEGIEYYIPEPGLTFIIKEDFSTEMQPLVFPLSEELPDSNSITIPVIKCNLAKDRLPYEDSSIDIITCFETLEHLWCDPMNLFAEANRVINDSGLFFLSTPNANSLSNIKKILNYESPNFYPPFVSTHEVIEHVKEYSINEIKLLFESAGFEIIKLDTFNHVDSKEFSHYESFQVNYLNKSDDEIEKMRNDDKILSEKISRFLSQLNESDKNRGDYILAVAKKCSDVKNRYCYPVYET